MREKVKRIIFLGFNKTATLSLHQFFSHNGYQAIHWVEECSGKFLALQMKRNIESKVPVLDGFSSYQVFSDLTYVDYNTIIEGNEYYRVLAQEYSDSLFILNTRPTDDWLLSRLRHSNLVERYRKILNCNLVQLIEHWRNLKESRESEIEDFFSDASNFMKFDITEGFDSMLDFISSHGFAISHRAFPHENKRSDSSHQSM
jgi:hypothetical protein